MDPLKTLDKMPNDEDEDGDYDHDHRHYHDDKWNYNRKFERPNLFENLKIGKIIKQVCNMKRK